MKLVSIITAIITVAFSDQVEAAGEAPRYGKEGFLDSNDENPYHKRELLGRLGPVLAQFKNNVFDPMAHNMMDKIIHPLSTLSGTLLGRQQDRTTDMRNLFNHHIASKLAFLPSGINNGVLTYNNPLGYAGGSSGGYGSVFNSGNPPVVVAPVADAVDLYGNEVYGMPQRRFAYNLV